MRKSRTELYKYGIHLTPGLAEVKFYAAALTSFPAAGFRVRRFRGIPALKTSLGARATTSGFGWLGWLRYARRSRTACLSARIRYIVRSEQR